MTPEERDTRRKIKRGVYPRWIFGSRGVQKLMLRQGVWTLKNPGGKETKINVGKFIPTMDTFLFLTKGLKA